MSIDPIHDELYGVPILIDFETSKEEFDEINENTVVKILNNGKYLQKATFQTESSGILMEFVKSSSSVNSSNSYSSFSFSFPHQS